MSCCERLLISIPVPLRMQTYYKLSYVDGRIPHPEHRLCEDIPRFCDGLADLLREWINSAVDAAVFAFLLRRYSRSHKYTAGIMAYVLGAGVMTTIFAPNFGKLYSRQQENEGTDPALVFVHGMVAISRH